MSDNPTQCPICIKNSEVESVEVLDRIYKVNCPRCGIFRITEEAIDLVREPKKAPELFKISAYLRERTIAKQPTITVVTSRKNIGKIQGAVVGVDDMLAESFPKTVSERLDRALKNLYRLSRHPGAGIPLSAEKDYPLFFAENEDAFVFLRGTLEEAGLIMFGGTTISPTIILTFNGWNRIAEIEREKAGKDSIQAFVAMWFDDSLEAAYKEGIEKAIRTTGYEPLRVDLKEHNEKICDTIIAEIRKSRFMIADFTGHRGGVYFEAGYALGLDIPVIWTCRDDHKDELHFDTRQYNHILWTDEHDLFEKLRRRIEATIPPI